MPVASQIKEDLNAAVKSGDSTRAGLLRMLLAQIHNREIEKRSKGELSDDDVMDVLRKEVKKRKESIELFKKGQREDLWKKEEQEMELISAYLPPAPTEEDVRNTIEELKSQGITEFPAVMKEAMARLPGADGATVARIAKRE